MKDHLTYYEDGLMLLVKQVDRNHPRYTDMLALEAGLKENIRAARTLRESRDQEAKRDEVLLKLNMLVEDILDISFNMLCDMCVTPLLSEEQSMYPASAASTVAYNFLLSVLSTAQQALDLLTHRERIWPINCQYIVASLKQCQTSLQVTNSLPSDTIYEKLVVSLFNIDEQISKVIQLVQSFEHICHRQSKQAVKARSIICERLGELVTYIESTRSKYPLIRSMSALRKAQKIQLK